MISPLQIWQHPQPRRIWWILGGLSVLAHVGVLGLCLPYVLEVTQSSRQSQLAEAIPIELVDIAADGQTSTNSTALEESTALKSPPAKREQTSVDNLEPVRSAENRIPPSDFLSTRSSDAGSANLGAADSESVDSGSADSGAADSESTESESVEDSSSGGSDRTDIPEPPLQPQDSTGEDSAGTETGEPPVIPGGNPLPAPGESTGNETEQTVSLSIMGSSEVPEDLQRDLADSPPQLISDGREVAAIPWRPQSLGCGQVDFSQPTGTYKMAVNADGTLDQATLWTEGTSRPVSEAEAAIACLLENADLQFEPAQLNGEPVFNDNLLLTVEIIELQAN